MDDHNILNDTKNRAETTYLNIFLSLKSGSFWVRGNTELFMCFHIMVKYHFKILKDKKFIAILWVFGQNFYFLSILYFEPILDL